MSLRMIVSDRRYWPLFWTQFFGALNDNVFKNALVILVSFRGARIAGLDPGSVVALAGGLFVLPFFLFSPLAGQISDRMEKSRLVRITKWWEVLIMTLAAFGFYTEQFGLLLVVLFGAGVQAALFGPVKYSLLPDLVVPERLLEANAYVETGTFLAILLGTILGGVLVSLPSSHFYISLTLLFFALAGVFTAGFVPAVNVAAPNLRAEINPLRSFASIHRILRLNSLVYNSVIGISWFWFFGAAVLSILPVYCKDFLHVDEGVVTCFLAMFTVGIGAGSILCEKLSPRGRIELGLVPLGSLGLSLFLIGIYWAPPLTGAAATLVSLSEMAGTGAGIFLMVCFFLMSVAGGLFILPLYTLLQERSLAESRSRVIAGNNIMNAVFMVAASLLVMLFHAVHMSYPCMFMVLAVMNLVAAAYIYTAAPEFLRSLRGRHQIN